MRKTLGAFIRRLDEVDKECTDEPGWERIGGDGFKFECDLFEGLGWAWEHDSRVSRLFVFFFVKVFIILTP